MSKKNPKPVNMITLEPVRLESADGVAKIVEPGTLITNCESDLAYQLAGAGKARVATEEEVAEARNPKKSEKPSG